MYNKMMGFTIEQMLIVFFSVMSIAFAVLYFRSLFKLKQAIKVTAQLIFTNQALEQQSGIKSTEDITDIHKENFIKFLSDSRDWAFQYIEEVQNGLAKFIEQVDPHIEYYNNFGSAVEGVVSPHDNALKKISKEFEDLKKLLPEDIDDRR